MSQVAWKELVMSKKRHSLVLAAVAATSLLACSSAPTEGTSSESSKYIFRPPPICQPGGQYASWWVQTWGTIGGYPALEGNTRLNWWNIGQTYWDGSQNWSAYAAFELGTQQVPYITWVPDASINHFAQANFVCVAFAPDGTTNPPGNGTDSSSAPRDPPPMNPAPAPYTPAPPPSASCVTTSQYTAVANTIFGMCSNAQITWFGD